MIVALWIIAICEVLRDIYIIYEDITRRAERKSLNAAFIESLSKSNKEWATDLLNEFLAEGKEDDYDYERASDMRDYCERYEPTYNSEDGSM